MEDLCMFQRPRTVALEYEKPRTYGTVLIYPLYRLVECGSAGALTQIIVHTLKSENFDEIFGLSGFFQLEWSTWPVWAAPKPEP
ncbi:hypothetical protein PIB30_022160 [Stylosanthes scabra]|uniref:Uncharacterized protein n=1 Tax=Stylosanthes scabra TaxID=79078 RepID=A0ABU6VC45_9FABA|nr:hypothetical protein [Stylosanthes scabra]